MVTRTINVDGDIVEENKGQSGEGCAEVNDLTALCVSLSKSQSNR